MYQFFLLTTYFYYEKSARREARVEDSELEWHQ